MDKLETVVLPQTPFFLEKRHRAAFSEYYGQTYQRYFRAMMILATMLFILFGGLDFLILDHSSLQPYREPILDLRFLFALPVLLCLNVLAFTPLTKVYHQWIGGFYVLVIEVSLWVMVMIAPDSVRHIYFTGLLMTQLAGLIVSRLRFLPAFIASFILSIFVFYGSFSADFDPLTRVTQLFFFVSVVLLGLVACLSNEMHVRTHFLKMRRLKEDKDKLRKDNDSLHYLADNDSLTGLPNRRYFDENFAQEWRRAIRNRYSLAVCMIDIDHFKQFNDHYGHRQGDLCLTRIGAVLSGFAQRPGDLVARYGGEEFILLLSGVESNKARRIAEKICRAVEALQLKHEYSSAKPVVTVSIGVASIRARDSEPGAVEIKDRFQLIERADRQLYRAKKLGKNRVSCDSTVAKVQLCGS